MGRFLSTLLFFSQTRVTRAITFKKEDIFMKILKREDNGDIKFLGYKSRFLKESTNVHTMFKNLVNFDPILVGKLKGPTMTKTHLWYSYFQGRHISATALKIWPYRHMLKTEISQENSKKYFFNKNLKTLFERLL
jgi:hypothetical protein